uniref:Uncharacterized protein n=1 Tax=uncultured marine virus TaxID=186617 RepID=A0A0F7L4F5_9VIRU|nr:hypothetical protein [uncultured marine virus]
MPGSLNPGIEAGPYCFSSQSSILIIGARSTRTSGTMPFSTISCMASIAPREDPTRTVRLPSTLSKSRAAL